LVDYDRLTANLAVAQAFFIAAVAFMGIASLLRRAPMRLDAIGDATALFMGDFSTFHGSS
jgi:hypothetical protein